MEQHDLTSQPATPIKKSRLLGIIAFFLLLAAGALLAYVGLSAVRAYLGGNLGSLNVGRILTSVKITVILSGASCLLALITLFLKGQKKGLAIFTLIFALLLFLVIGAMQYAYHSVNSSINRDESFAELPDEELLVTPQQPGGKIDFELDIPVETISKEEIEDIKIKNELDWPLLEETDVPNNAYPYMSGQSPSSPCVLLPGAEQIGHVRMNGVVNGFLIRREGGFQLGIGQIQAVYRYMVVPEPRHIQTGALRHFVQCKVTPEVQHPAGGVFFHPDPLAADLVFCQHTGHEGEHIRRRFFPGSVPEQDGGGQLDPGRQSFPRIRQTLFALFHPAAVPEQFVSFHHDPARTLSVAVMGGSGRPAEHRTGRINGAEPASFPDSAAVEKYICDFQHTKPP